MPGECQTKGVVYKATITKRGLSGYNQTSKACRLCLLESYHIMFSPEGGKGEEGDHPQQARAQAEEGGRQLQHLLGHHGEGPVWLQPNQQSLPALPPPGGATCIVIAYDSLIGIIS